MTHNLHTYIFDIIYYSTFYPIRHFDIRRFVPFDILAFDILSHSMLFLFDILFHSMFCPIRRFDIMSLRRFVPFDILSVRHFVCSTFYIIRHFGIRHFVSFDVLSFDVLSFRRLLLRHFVGEPSGLLLKYLGPTSAPPSLWSSTTASRFPSTTLQAGSPALRNLNLSSENSASISNEF